VAPLQLPPVTAPRSGASASAAAPGNAAKTELPADAGSGLADGTGISAAAGSASVPAAQRAPLVDAAPRAPLLDAAPRAPLVDATPRTPILDAAPRAPLVAAAPRASAAAPANANDGQRAKALLEGATLAGTAPAADTSGPASVAIDGRPSRFIVQVGAYADANAVREARQKVEKLGLKTYTQVIDAEAGKRTRVRVGPFATREEAETAWRTLKAAGLPGNILTW